MKELTPEEGKKPKAYRFARLGLTDAYEAFRDRVENPVQEPTNDHLEPERFAREMQGLRVKKKNRRDERPEGAAIAQSQSLSRLIRRVKLAVKRLAGHKLRRAVKKIIR